MNLAIEYMIRTGTAQEAFESPCSLYLRSFENANKKLIVTIHYNQFSHKYSVKHWLLDDWPITDLIPSFVEHTIEKEVLFTSDKVIVPNYMMLPFKDRPYEAGVTQRSDGEMADLQAEEYQETLNEFYYPQAHKRIRISWLWSCFIRSHKIEIPDSINYQKVKEQMRVVENNCKSIWSKWKKWLESLEFNNSIAPELVFNEAYSNKLSKEITSFPKSYMNVSYDYNEHSTFVSGISKKNQYMNAHITEYGNNRNALMFQYYYVMQKPNPSSGYYALVTHGISDSNNITFF